MVTKAEAKEAIAEFKKAAERLINVADDLTNAEKDDSKSSTLSRCLDGLESQTYDPNGLYPHAYDKEGIAILSDYVDGMEDDGEDAAIYKEVSLKTLVKTFGDWNARWEKETYPGSDSVSLDMPLLALNDGSDASFPKEANGLWTYLDQDGFVSFFKTKEGAIAYINSNEDDDHDKVEI